MGFREGTGGGLNDNITQCVLYCIAGKLLRENISRFCSVKDFGLEFFQFSLNSAVY